jgi:hypothetical protein
MMTRDNVRGFAETYRLAPDVAYLAMLTQLEPDRRSTDMAVEIARARVGILEGEDLGLERQWQSTAIAAAEELVQHLKQWRALGKLVPSLLFFTPWRQQWELLESGLRTRTS